MDLKTAASNAAIELRNIHREYLAGQHGGCPCITPDSHEACQVDVVLRDLEDALDLTEAN